MKGLSLNSHKNCVIKVDSLKPVILMQGIANNGAFTAEVLNRSSLRFQRGEVYNPFYQSGHRFLVLHKAVLLQKVRAKPAQCGAMT